MVRLSLDAARFAFNFFRQAGAENQNKNVLIAPTRSFVGIRFVAKQRETHPAKAEILDAFHLRNLSSEQIDHQSEMLRRPSLTSNRPRLQDKNGRLAQRPARG